MPQPEAPTQIVLEQRQFEAFRKLIYEVTGISLADNKRNLVQSRLQKRVRHHNLESYSAYYNFLKTQDPSGTELQEMVNRVTTNKTNFFRESHHFDYLRETVFPRLVDLAAKGQRPKKLRIWCAASSTGEEPYTLAMTTRDFFAGKPGWDLEITATDIDTAVLQKAESAIFGKHTYDEVPDELLKRHFIKGSGDDEQWIVQPETSRLVDFQRLNLLEEKWPVNGYYDVIFCRNVLIYFDKDTIDKIMRRMARYLAPDGYLFIGHSESLYRISDTYTRVGKTLYQHANTQADPAASVEPSGILAKPPGPQGLQGRPRPPVKKPKKALPKKSIIIGDVVASKTPMVIKTILGSCIAVCLYDSKSKIGGMNHFALPKGSSCSRAAASFGVHAMELLINEMMQLGADRRRMQAKVFGGANVLSSNGRCVGAQNIEFVKDFLRTEKLPVVGECLGGDCGLNVMFEAHTGRVRVKRLDKAAAVSANRTAESKPAPKAAPTSDITLF